MNKYNNIIVTATNVTKLSEDVLLEVFEQLPESNPTYILIDSELNRRADLYNRNEKLKIEQQIQTLVELQTLKSNIHLVLHGFKGERTKYLIEKLGQEYVDDYAVCPITFKVTSDVAYKVDHCGTWEHTSVKEAHSKLASLLYDRIYNRYIRDVTSQNLTFLNKVLCGGMCA